MRESTRAWERTPVTNRQGRTGWRQGLNLAFAGILLSLSIVAMHAALANPARTSEEAMQLDQTHTFLGHCRLTVCPRGLRLESLARLKFILVASAPDWKVTIFRHDDKTYITQSWQEFSNSGLVSGFVMLPQDRHMVKSIFRKSTYDLCGQKVIRLTSPRTTLKYLPREDLPEPAELILLAAYKTPTNGGIPIGFVRAHSGKDYVTGMSQEGQLETILDTSTISLTDYNPKLFSPPSGYKQVKSVGEVVTGSSVRAESGEFQDLFDIKPVGDRHKK